MSKRLLVGVLLLALPSAVFAAVREFTDHEGNTLKAELTGAKDGQVILKEKGTRKSIPLSAFTLDDRDYIVKTLIGKKQENLILELMNYELQNTRQPAAASIGTGAPGDASIPAPPGVPAGIPNTISGGAIAPPAKPAPKEMYGFTFPIDELVGAPELRFWTDLRGEKIQATYEQVVSPGLVFLKSATGLPQRVPLVNLSTSDIQFIHAAIAADQNREVFPPGQFVEPTPEESGKGYRVWTDRRGEKLGGKYLRRSGRDTVLEVAGQETPFPTVGFSKEDRAWIDAEEQRKIDELRRQQAAAAAAAAARQQASAGNSGFPGGRFGPRPGMGGMPGGGSPWAVPTLQYEFTCRRCKNKWTSSSPIDRCSNCKDTYDFHCYRCGHSWSRQGTMIDKCPKCSGASNNPPAGIPPGANPTTNYVDNAPASSSWTSDSSSGGSSSYRAGRFVGKLTGWVFAALAGLWGVNKVRGG